MVEIICLSLFRDTGCTEHLHASCMPVLGQSVEQLHYWLWWSLAMTGIIQFIRKKEKWGNLKPVQCGANKQKIGLDNYR